MKERKQETKKTVVAQATKPAEPKPTGVAEVDAMTKEELAAALRAMQEQRERQKSRQRERNRIRREAMTEEEKQEWRDRMKSYEVRKRERRAAMVTRAKQFGLTS